MTDTKEEISKAAVEALKVIAEAAREARSVITEAANIRADKFHHKEPDMNDPLSEHPTIEERFIELRNTIKQTLTIGLAALTLIIALEGGLILWVLNVQKESIADRSQIHKEIVEFKADFGTTLLIFPKEHQQGFEWIYDQLTQKYNPKRGTDTK